MAENNDLPYKSKTDHAHMCGHDGHMTTLMTFADLLMKNRHKIPSNKLVRLIFQPAEEGPGGAPVMIQEGCLEGIDEIYGIHNWPTGVEGTLNVSLKEQMAGVIIVNIKIVGRGGHGSEPANSIDPITAGCMIHTALHTIKSRKIFNSTVASFTICQFNSGTTFNVIPETCEMAGTIRYFDYAEKDKILASIRSITSLTAEAHGCKVEIGINEIYPPTINHETQARVVQTAGRDLLGEENVNNHLLPVMASEDFSFFLQKIPGCYFFLASNKEGVPVVGPHSSFYQFNDNLLAIGASVYAKIIENRFAFKFN